MKTLSACATALGLGFFSPPTAAAVLPLCGSVGSGSACIFDGDSGSEDGSKWRLKDIDAPEISVRRAQCRVEQIKGIRARDRMRVLMARGYLIMNTGKADQLGRSLVNIKLSDGRDLGLQMMSEDLVQAWPNTGNIWCGREQ